MIPSDLPNGIPIGTVVLAWFSNAHLSRFMIPVTDSVLGSSDPDEDPGNIVIFRV